MSKKTTTSYEAITRVLRRGPKRGLTAVDIAGRAGIALNTTRSSLSDLVASEQVSVVGSFKTGERGRPANLYALAA